MAQETRQKEKERNKEGKRERKKERTKEGRRRAWFGLVQLGLACEMVFVKFLLSFGWLVGWLAGNGCDVIINREM